MPGFQVTVLLAILIWTSPFLGTTRPRWALSLVLVGPAWAGITVPPSTSEKAALHLGQPEASGNFWINLEDGLGYLGDTEGTDRSRTCR